jgi:hypothetical protein
MKFDLEMKDIPQLVEENKVMKEFINLVVSNFEIPSGTFFRLELFEEIRKIINKAPAEDIEREEMPSPKVKTTPPLPPIRTKDIAIKKELDETDQPAEDKGAFPILEAAQSELANRS